MNLKFLLALNEIFNKKKDRFQMLFVNKQKNGSYNDFLIINITISIENIFFLQNIVYHHIFIEKHSFLFSKEI